MLDRNFIYMCRERINLGKSSRVMTCICCCLDVFLHAFVPSICSSLLYSRNKISQLRHRCRPALEFRLLMQTLMLNVLMELPDC